MKDSEIAWVAGIVEGEGTITLKPPGTAILSIMMTDEDVIRRLHAITGFGTINGPYTNGGRTEYKKIWRWNVAAQKDVSALLPALLPWLGKRRSARAKEALELIANAPGRGAKPRKTHCPQGHGYTEENTAWQKRDGRLYQVCIICRRRASRNWARRKRNQKDA